MALKRLKTKRSKRMTGRLKHKIEKKVRQHNKKERRVAKKNSKKTSQKQKLIQIPNICPFKEDILKDVEEAKQRKESERIAKREAAKLQRSTKFSSIGELLDDANKRETAYSTQHEKEMKGDEKEYNNADGKEQSLKQYFKEFRKVIENADVILEVVDARDPLGTRCPEVEQAVRDSPGNKRLVLVLNKADLVPKENLNSWIKYFRCRGPVTAFKASTQEQSSKLGRRKLHAMKTEKAMQGSVCIGAELLMSMLGNYCRNKNIKTSIRVGVVGIPNVGKSSIINSLTRGRSCMVGSTPGVTKVMQEIELDSKIKMIDCPGIVFTDLKKDGSASAVLKNAQKVSDVKDPFSIAELILKRASKEYFCKLYDITDYDTYEEFFAKKASRMGKLLKNGVPDVVAAARSILNDWNSGKIKYCTQPPKSEDLQNVHISASIVHHEAREFDIDNFEAMESELLNKFDVKKEDVVEITSTDPITITAQAEENQKDALSNINVVKNISRPQKRKSNIDKNEQDPAMLLQENQTLNKNLKEMQKKRKKNANRNEKKIAQISDVLDNFSLDSSLKDDDYDFDEIC